MSYILHTTSCAAGHANQSNRNIGHETSDYLHALWERFNHKTYFYIVLIYIKQDKERIFPDIGIFTGYLHSVGNDTPLLREVFVHKSEAGRPPAPPHLSQLKQPLSIFQNCTQFFTSC